MSYRPRRRSLVASRGPYHQGFRPLAPNTRRPGCLGKSRREQQGSGASPSVFTSLQVDSLLSHAIVILGDNLSYLIGSSFGPWAERRFFADEKVARRRAWAERSLPRFGMQVSLSASTSTFPMTTSAAGICRFPPSRSTREAQVSAGHATGWRPAATTACGEPAASSFGPYRASLPAASAEDSPPTGATATRAARSATVSQPVAKDPPVIPLPCPTACTEARAGRPGLRCPWSRPASRPSVRCSSPYAR